jgi:hypothetical protein
VSEECIICLVDHVFDMSCLCLVSWQMSWREQRHHPLKVFNISTYVF